MTASGSTPWPALPYEAWEPTKETLHRYAQIVGKVRMALMPFRNHWWHVTLLPATRGLTTGPMPYGSRWVEIALDLLDHRLVVTTQPLAPGDASWQDAGAGSLAVLPYDAVRTAADPARELVGFLDAAYRAGATTAGWDVDALSAGRTAG